MLKGLSKIAMIYASAAILFGMSAVAQSSKTEEKAKTAETTKPAETKGDKKMSEVYAIFDTSMGKFKAKLFADKAPETVKTLLILQKVKVIKWIQNTKARNSMTQQSFIELFLHS